MKKRYKKATLAISIGAIVIIVIAFVVLGLGLVLTKTIFGKAKEAIPGIFEVAKLGKEPTAEVPLTIRKDISIKRKDTKPLDVGFYNTGISLLPDVEIDIRDCLSVATGMGVDEELAEGEESKAPTIRSLKQDVEEGEPIGYLVYLKENGLATGEYLCKIMAVDKKGTPEDIADDEIFESEQISLTVTT